MLSLASLLKPDRLTAVVDVGADPTDGSLPPAYTPLLERGLCTLVGFEPRRESLDKLILSAGPNETYLSVALADGSKKLLRTCECGGMTSILKPNIHHLAAFNDLPELGKVVEERWIETERLDDIAEIGALDFLKIDAQGAELEIMRHGRERLSSAVAVQTEVSFVTVYENQPTIGDIDRELRSLGMIPHCIAETKLWPISPAVMNDNPRMALRQVMEADLVYVRDFTDDGNMTAEQWKHLAMIAHYCYGSYDLAIRALSVLRRMEKIAETAITDYFAMVLGEMKQRREALAALNPLAHEAAR